jgi:transposase, IS5 family
LKGASLVSLSKKEYKNFLVVSEVYRQQLWMYENKAIRIDDRIVSINQPHIRPIVRGKAGSSVEFGAKISASCVDNYIFLNRLSWDNFNESQDFIQQVEAFKQETGYYPSSVHVDKIYRTRKNRAFCKEKGIIISGVPLGRPPKNTSIEAKKQAQEDEKIRNCIEGKFGQGKRRFSLNRIMTKLEATSRTSIAITFLVINLSRLLKEDLIAFLCQFFARNTVFSAYDYEPLCFDGLNITLNYLNELIKLFVNRTLVLMLLFQQTLIKKPMQTLLQLNHQNSFGKRLDIAQSS